MQRAKWTTGWPSYLKDSRAISLRWALLRKQYQPVDPSTPSEDSSGVRSVRPVGQQILSPRAQLVKICSESMRRAWLCISHPT